jgi:hypothetical protein
MFSSRRTSFSSDDTYIPNVRRSSPVALRQLVVHDLDDTNPIDLSRQQEPFRIPRPNITIPNSSRYPPTNNSVWTPYTLPTRVQEYSPSPNPSSRTHLSEQPFYQISPPPSPYQIVRVPFQRPSPIRRIKRNKYRQEKTPGLCTTLCTGGLGTLAVLIYLTIVLALPTTKLVLGILYINECPVNKNIPLYMIVSGACGLAIILFLLLSSTCTFCRSSTIARKPTHQCMIGTTAFARGMQGVLAIFLFIWFFIGNYWVFGARYLVRTDNSSDANYCKPALYWFAFYVLIFTYVYAMFICFMKFCVNFFCCGACEIWKRAFS